MVDMTDDQRERTGAIVAKIHEIDWNGDITPWIDSIVAMVGELVQEDPMFADFAEAIQSQANQWSLAAWSENLVPTIADSGWSQLSDRLTPFISNG